MTRTNRELLRNAVSVLQSEAEGDSCLGCDRDVSQLIGVTRPSAISRPMRTSNTTTAPSFWHAGDSRGSERALCSSTRFEAQHAIL